MAILKKNERSIGLKNPIDLLQRVTVTINDIFYSIPIIPLSTMLTKQEDEKGQPKLAAFNASDGRVIIFPVADKDYSVQILGTVSVIQ
jgi:hypothetical protein